MHEGYIIISESCKVTQNCLAERYYVHYIRNMVCLAVYSQIIRKQYNIFSQFVRGMCTAMIREKASFRSANQESAKIN